MPSERPVLSDVLIQKLRGLHGRDLHGSLTFRGICRRTGIGPDRLRSWMQGAPVSEPGRARHLAAVLSIEKAFREK